eukprot:COSAG02_NODE_262_length_26647_cov_21.607240_5_plen_508_part_00
MLVEEAGLEEVKFCDVIDELPGMKLDDEILFRPYSSASCAWQTPPADTPSPPAEVTENHAAKPSSVEHATSAEVGLAEKHVEQAAEAMARKRASRLERNRQSAQNLRERRRLYTQRVEAELEASKAHVVQLGSQVSALTAENGVLRQENEFLRGVLQGRSNPESPVSSTPPSRPPGKRARRAGAMTLSVAAVLGLAACHQSVPQFGGVSDGAESTAHRAMLEHDESTLLALPDDRDYDTEDFGTAAAAAGQVPTLSQALLPYVHVRDDGEVSEATMDWPALCQLGALQLGSHRHILLPFSDLQDLGWLARTSAVSTMGHDWHQQVATPPPVPIRGRELFGAAHASAAVHALQDELIIQGGVSRSGQAAHISSTENDGDLEKPNAEHPTGESRTSSSSSSSEHIHRVLHMLSSMSQDDKKVMLHLLTSDAEHDEPLAENSSNSGSTSMLDGHEHSQWTVASRSLSSLSILLPAMPHSQEGKREGEGAGAAEVVELSCGLARTWRISAD